MVKYKRNKGEKENTSVKLKDNQTSPVKSCEVLSQEKSLSIETISDNEVNFVVENEEVLTLGQFEQQYDDNEFEVDFEGELITALDEFKNLKKMNQRL
ncbi:hypothetical protein SUGI_1051860 [Cryptomeria japonica]|nr:hypothetical protein SUGI_1051860 [Cryptomeria japonica]